MTIESKAAGARRYLLGLQARMETAKSEAGLVNKLAAPGYFISLTRRMHRIDDALRALDRQANPVGTVELLVESIEDNVTLAEQDCERRGRYAEDAGDAYKALVQLVGEDAVTERARRAYASFVPQEEVASQG